MLYVSTTINSDIKSFFATYLTQFYEQLLYIHIIQVTFWQMESAIWVDWQGKGGEGLLNLPNQISIDILKL